MKVPILGPLSFKSHHSGTTFLHFLHSGTQIPGMFPFWDPLSWNVPILGPTFLECCQSHPSQNGTLILRKVHFPLVSGPAAAEFSSGFLNFNAFLRFWGGVFVKKARASLERYRTRIFLFTANQTNFFLQPTKLTCPQPKKQLHAWPREADCD